jgi:hypothetical protein
MSLAGYDRFDAAMHTASVAQPLKLLHYATATNSYDGR